MVDKVNAAKLNREFKSFRAFMKQLDDRAPAGEPFSLGPRRAQDEKCRHLQIQHEAGAFRPLDCQTLFS